MSIPPTCRTLGDLIADKSLTGVQDGNHGGSHPKASEYVASGIPFVMASDIAGGRIDLDSCKKITKARADRLRIGFAKPGDVLLTHKGTVGQVAIVPECPDYLMLTPQVTYYRADCTKLDARYLAACFRSQPFQAQLDNISAQSTRPYVSLSTQRRLEIPWLPIGDQKRIGAIVGAYDDLIEVNRRRVAVLESMARGLFEEWFVRLRFPGLGHADIIETVAGPLPRDWELTTLGERLTVVLGGTPSRQKSEFWGGDVPWLNSGKANDLRVTQPSEYITESGLNRSSTKLMPAGTTIIAITGATLGQYSLLTAPMCGNQSLVGVFDTSGYLAEYLYRFIGYHIQAMIRAASGGAQQHINKEVVARYPFVVPSDDILIRYKQLADPIGELVSNALLQSESLAIARDLLLPRLLSGRLTLRAAERELAEAA